MCIATVQQAPVQQRKKSADNCTRTATTIDFLSTETISYTIGEEPSMPTNATLNGGSYAREITRNNHVVASTETLPNKIQRSTPRVTLEQIDVLKKKKILGMFT